MESACRFSSAKVVEIVKCFLNIVSKIRQICIISARFCGWKCALVAQIDMKSQSEFLNEFLLLCWYFSVSILRSKQNIEHAVLQNVHFSLLSTMNVTIWQNFCLNWSILWLNCLTISTTLAQHAASIRFWINGFILPWAWPLWCWLL